MAPTRRFWGAVQSLTHSPGDKIKLAPRGVPRCPLCGEKRAFGHTLIEHQNSLSCRQGQGRLQVLSMGLEHAGALSEVLLDTAVPLLRGDAIHVGLVPHQLFAPAWAVQLAAGLMALIGQKAKLAIAHGEATKRPAQIRELAVHVMAKAQADERWRRAMLVSLKISGAKDTMQLFLETLPRRTPKGTAE